MNKRVERAIAPKLFERFETIEPTMSRERILRKWSRSLICMSCAGCCHSSLVPIELDEARRFHERLGAPIGLDLFISRFTQSDSFKEGANSHIEMRANGGRCHFLEKMEDRSYRCVAWDERPEVCRDFFCWPMRDFERYEEGLDQARFDPAAGWEENLALLVDAVLDEIGGALFADDLFYYFKSSRAEKFRAAYDIELERISSTEK